MDEFDFIRELLAPLAGEGAFGLTDDAAMLRPDENGLVVTADMLVEGRHFTPHCPPDSVAKKSLRVNLSDLAAKGARPVCYLLSIAWRTGQDLDWKRAFVRGLKEDQDRYGVYLLGGDTTVTDGPLTVSITAFGAPGPRGMIRRAGAQPGDCVFVTGEIGGAGLALRVLADEPMPAGVDRAALVAAYREPEPPVPFASVVAAHAHVAIDVSDGVLADAAHIAEVSGVQVEIDLERLPLAPATRTWLEGQQDRDAALAALASAGDDYQILFAAPEEAAETLVEEASALGVRLTRIGRIVAGKGLKIIVDSREIRPDRLGFTHF